MVKLSCEFHKNLKKSSLLLGAMFFVKLVVADASFAQLWQEMQSIYHPLATLEQEIHLSNLVLPTWEDFRKPIRDYIQGSPDEQFLFGPIAGFMVAGDVSDASLNYILHQTKRETRELINRYRDTTFGGLSIACKQLYCTADTLRQHYFMARILDNKKSEEINQIVELGGGYGRLARIATSILPSTSYIIIDLPEMLALQYLFLKGSLPELKVYIHASIPTTFEQGAIHLVPYFLLPKLDLFDTDVFVSIVALSETSRGMQNLVIEKKFFNASLCYVMGQKAHQLFLPEQTIVQGVKSLYKSSTYADYNHFYGGCYEIMGIN